MKNAILIVVGVALCWLWTEGWEGLFDWSGIESEAWQVALVLLLTAVCARLILGPTGKPPIWQRWLWRRARHQAGLQGSRIK